MLADRQPSTQIVVNLQKITISRSVRSASSPSEFRGSRRVDLTFSVAFVSDNRMKELNQLFRGKDTTTDVLSFPHEPDEFETVAARRGQADGTLGDIVISVEQAHDRPPKTTCRSKARSNS